MTRSKGQDDGEHGEDALHEPEQDHDSDDIQATEGEVLPPGSVKLSDGRIAVVKRTTGVHDLRVDKFLGRMGYTLTGLGGMVYTRFRAILAVEYLDGEYVFFPKNAGQLEGRLDMPTADIEAIMRVYARVNGYDQVEGEDGDFRP